MDKQSTELTPTVKPVHKSKEGLMKQDGKTIYDDGWMHSDIDEDVEKYMSRAINNKYRTKKEEPKPNTKKSIPLEIDLEKGTRTLNRGKLIQRRVPVHGKNGKIFYRLQWVDPKTGLPVSKQGKQEEPPKEKPKEHLDAPIEKEGGKGESEDKKPFPLEATKKKEYDLNSQHGKIEKFIDDLSKAEKEKMLEKYDIQWDKHAHPMKDWMNAIMALKKYAHEHPEIAGADHLPAGDSTATKKTPEGTDIDQDALNNMSMEDIYKLMKETGIADQNPFDVPEWAKNAKLRHFNNMCKLKNYLKDNPHLLDGLKQGTAEKPPVAKPTPGSKPTSSNKSAAQKGGNTIQGILSSMSREKKYELMKRLGIADEDPGLNAKYGPKDQGGNGMAPMIHMKNMMDLKKAIEQDPSILNYGDNEKATLSKDEHDRLSGMDKQQKADEDLKQFVAKMSKDMKEDLLSEYATEPEIFKRKTSDNEGIDWMYAMQGLKNLFKRKPELMDANRERVENEELMTKKITNKQMEKILRRFLGAKGEYAQVRQVEKYKEWEFGNGSFARIDLDDDGTPILSVVDTGEDGGDWNESKYSLKEVHEYLNDMKGTGDEESLPEAKEIPLHEKNIIEIEKAMQQSVDKNYTPEVGKVLQDYMRDLWNTAGNSNSLSDLAKLTHKMGIGTLSQLMHKWGIKVEPGNTFNDKGNEWKQIAYGHMVEGEKSKNANDYLVKDKDGKYDTWVLHQSAKQWSPEERSIARKDLIGSRLNINEPEDLIDLGESIDHLQEVMTNHYHKSTEFIPFDMFSDLLAGGASIHFDKTIDGQTFIGNHFSHDDNSIHFNHRYLEGDAQRRSLGDPFQLQPERDDSGYGQHRFASAAAHETAHALDHFLSGGSGKSYLDWNTEVGKKYVPERYRDCVHESYDSAVNKSNPQRKLGKYESDSQPYYYHKDEWISVYEGRIYGNAKGPDGIANMQKLSDGSLSDPFMDSLHYRGLEHWSTSVARYSDALQAFKSYQQDNPSKQGESSMLEWALSGYRNTRSDGYAGDYESSKPVKDKEGNEKKLKNNMFNAKTDNPHDAFGYDYYAMTKYHPDMAKAILNIFNRGDFADDRTSYKATEAYRQGDYTRKSEDLIVYL